MTLRYGNCCFPRNSTKTNGPHTVSRIKQNIPTHHLPATITGCFRRQSGAGRKLRYDLFFERGPPANQLPLPPTRGLVFICFVSTVNLIRPFSEALPEAPPERGHCGCSRGWVGELSCFFIVGVFVGWHENFLSLFSHAFPCSRPEVNGDHLNGSKKIEEVNRVRLGIESCSNLD